MYSSYIWLPMSSQLCNGGLFKSWKHILLQRQTVFSFGNVYILLVAFCNSYNVMLKYFNSNHTINTKVFAYWLVDKWPKVHWKRQNLQLRFIIFMYLHENLFFFFFLPAFIFIVFFGAKCYSFSSWPLLKLCQVSNASVLDLYK